MQIVRNDSIFKVRAYLSPQQACTNDFTQAQTNGADFGTAIWTLARQLRRELDYDLQAVKSDSEVDTVAAQMIRFIVVV